MDHGDDGCMLGVGLRFGGVGVDLLCCGAFGAQFGERVLLTVTVGLKKVLKSVGVDAETGIVQREVLRAAAKKRVNVVDKKGEMLGERAGEGDVTGGVQVERCAIVTRLFLKTICDVGAEKGGCVGDGVVENEDEAQRGVDGDVQRAAEEDGHGSGRDRVRGGDGRSGDGARPWRTV